MTRVMKRLSKDRFKALSSPNFLQSGNEERTYYLNQFSFAVGVLYENLQIIGIVKFSSSGYILEDGTKITTDLQDFAYLNEVWDIGIELLRSTDKRMPFHQGSEDAILRCHANNQIFPVN